jgi:chromosomal replication initiator protein
MKYLRQDTSYPLLEEKMATIWDEVKTHIKDALPENSFSLWINPITLLEDKHHTLTLGCPNKFSLNWIIDNYMALIKENLAKIGDGQYDLALEVRAPKKSDPLPGHLEDSRQLSLPNVPEKGRIGSRRLNDEFTFDRFVVGKCNEFAYSAAKALALEQNLPYPSLFMLSNTGLGKSHLSQATGNAILENNPGLRVYYVTAEDFVNEMVTALKGNRIEEFKNKYRRSCDVLLLEEVHFLSGKEKTQLELAYTLDALVNNRKRIVFTSSLLPKDIRNISKELSSRLTSGIITTLDKPDFQTRVKILERKSAEQKLSLSEEIVHLLARHLPGDIRQMESALRCLKAKSELLGEKIDPDLAREVLKAHISDQDATPMESIQSLVCQYFKVDPLMLRSKSRKKIFSYPRNIYVYLCRQHTNTTVEEIGKSINRNHSTVVYSCEAIEKKKLKNQIHFLSEKLKDLTK